MIFGMSSEVEKSKIVDKIVRSSTIGGSQILLVFALTHPLDLMKTRMQADTQKLRGITYVKQIYHSNGLKGFYKAGIPNFVRAFSKEMYRSSLRGFFNSFYFGLLESSNLNKNYPDLKNLLTGITMSTIDTILCSPLERIKVWLMTNDNKKPSFSDYFYQKKSFSVPFKDLFRGLNVTFYRNAISWASFLIIEERIRNRVLLNKSHNLSQVTILDQLTIGTLSGIINSVITLPLDTIKTQFQKKDDSFKHGIFNAMRHIVAKKGVLSLWNGWQYRLPSYVIVAIITSSNIQKIDKIWNDGIK